MDKKCGNCRFFKCSKDIFGRCISTESRVVNKNTKTALSKPCSKWEADKNYNIELTFTENDKIILDKMLVKMEKEFPNKINTLRAKAIRHLLDDIDILKKEVLKK